MGAGQFAKFPATAEPALVAAAAAVTEVFLQFVKRFSDRALNLCSSSFSWKEFANFIRHVKVRGTLRSGLVKENIFLSLPLRALVSFSVTAQEKSGLCVHIPYIWSIFWKSWFYPEN